MSDTLDPLESELSALRPQPVSPGLRDRIAASLDSAAPSSSGDGRQSGASTGRIGRLVLTACLAAAVLLFVFVRWPLWRSLPETRNSNPNPAPQVSGRDRPSSTQGANNASAAVLPQQLDRDFSAFTWPLYETPPMKGYASIPADLLD
ncbi:MAG TPA: hypothetical protein VGZ47_12225 [Gemmataceae bacterium]|jgi:hypothetical protein|nr:hypothetical protein [Gemmataceae bacterium]